MDGWVKKTLGEVCTLQRGFDLPKRLREEGRFPLVSSSGLIDTHSEAKVNGPGVVTGRSGSIGSVFYIDDDFWPLNTTLYVKDFHGNDARFIYHLLNDFDLGRLASGAGVPTLNRNNVHSETVRIPSSIPEQERIVAILDEAFAAIATATANSEKNLANARELFESQSRSIFGSHMSTWYERPLGDVCKNLDSMRVPITKSKREAGDIPYYGASGVVDSVAEYLFDEDLLLVSEDGANLLARTYPIAFSISGKTWVNNHAHVLRFENVCYQKVIEYYLNSITLGSFVSGMAQPKLNQKALNGIPVPWIDDDAAIEATADSLRKMDIESKTLFDTYQRKIALITELRQSLLHKAFAGELTSNAADRELSEARV